MVAGVRCIEVPALERFRQRGTALAEGPPGVVLVAQGEQVECDEGGGCLLGQQPYPRIRRVDPLLQRLEIQTRLGGDHDLTVDDTPWR